MISLLSVAFLATSVFAIPATNKKMTSVEIAPQQNVRMNQQIAPDAQLTQKALVSQQKEVNNFTKPAAKFAAKQLEAEAPSAFYYKPDGSFFVGINQDETYIPHVFDLVYPTIFGSWLNGYQYWTWPNYCSEGASVTYVTSYDQRGYKGYKWTMDANHNYLDSLPALNFGDPTYLFSYRMPVQIASNEAGKDTFALYGPRTTRPDTLTTEVWTIGGMFNPFNTTDGLWPLTNAMFSTPIFGDHQGVIWGLNKEDEVVEFIYGTEPIALLVDVDTIYATDGITVEKLDSIYDTIQPSILSVNYEKPMSPLYVKSINVALCNIEFSEGTPNWEDIKIDTLQLLIIDKEGNPIAASIGTKEDTATTSYYPGQTLTFKLQKKDEYGTIIEGITLTDAFSIAIMGLDREGNRFGIWSALDPYLRGKRNRVIDDEFNTYSYAPYDPFIMLNGTFYTLEHALRTPYLWSQPAQYIDTINIAIEEEDGEYIAVHADGAWKDYIPMLRATELLYDTISKQYNYNIYAPEWALLDMDYSDNPYGEDDPSANWWTEFNAYNLYIWGDATDTDVEAPAVGDEIKLSRYGKELVFKVVSAPEPISAINNVVRTVNDGKRYNVLGIEVDENYKGVVIRNGEKFLQ